MFGTLKSFFSKKQSITITSDSEFYNPEPSVNPNFLTNQKKILDLLKHIEEASPLCTITIEGSNEQFSSSILEVELADGLIIFDKLSPSHGNKLITDKNKLKFSTIYDGIHLAFTVDNIAQGASQGNIHYKSTIPSKIFYPQRRSSPRFQITTFHIPFSGVSERTKATVGGSIFDISRKGLSLGVSITNNIARLQRGDLLQNCRMTFDNQTINFDLAIRFAKVTNKNTGKTIIGGYFENLSSKNKHKLERFVTSLEREEIRNRKA